MRFNVKSFSLEYNNTKIWTISEIVQIFSLHHWAHIVFQLV